MTNNAPTSARASLGFARLLSWITMGLILLSSLVISVIIANSARDTLLERQKDYALLMAENLNHQVYNISHSRKPLDVTPCPSVLFPIVDADETDCILS